LLKNRGGFPLKNAAQKSSDQEPLTQSAERLVDAATGLFAEHGYDGVSTRQIAAACGLSIATVHYHVGTKPELYRKVIARLNREEHALVHAALDRFRQGVSTPREYQELIGSLTDAMAGLCHASPQRARLYLRRWLDPDDRPGRDELRAYLALYKALEELVDRARASGAMRADFDTVTLLRSFDWLLYGYFVSGAPDLKSWCGDPHKKRNLDAFKSYLRDYVFRMTGLDAGQ
jgi:AcrR family transcriptional regulator